MGDFDFEKNIDERLAVIEEATNEDDVPFLVACVRHWKVKAEKLQLDAVPNFVVKDCKFENGSGSGYQAG